MELLKSTLIVAGMILAMVMINKLAVYAFGINGVFYLLSGAAFVFAVFAVHQFRRHCG